MGIHLSVVTNIVIFVQLFDDSEIPHGILNGILIIDIFSLKRKRIIRVKTLSFYIFEEKWICHKTLPYDAFFKIIF